MARCETCGNDYDRCFEVVVDGRSHLFDSFECAIHALAPKCNHCGCSIIGHGIEVADRIFCCASCARMSGFKGANDHVAVLKA